MALSQAERVRELARLVGIPITAEEITEVANRFDSLMRELESLAQLDLSTVQPVTIFPEEREDAKL
jgi:Asp-tRNA(Asn)/Glu-tRNA(Gln) amidotransferase C subunit